LTIKKGIRELVFSIALVKEEEEDEQIQPLCLGCSSFSLHPLLA
jgi:hypothetical protein